MPRSRRKQGESGIHHIMLRGINQQQIFQDEEDCFKFLCIVCECKEISKYKLYAYCLMGNHIFRYRGRFPVPTIISCKR